MHILGAKHFNKYISDGKTSVYRVKARLLNLHSLAEKRSMKSRASICARHARPCAGHPPYGKLEAQFGRTGYFSILLCNCQKRTVRWAVSIDSFR
jgi:hypothetical protein